MTNSVREPIQVYLSAEERSDLDRAASELGVSRSEVLRRGVEAMSDPEPTGPSQGERAGAGPLISRPSRSTVDPPPRKPVSPLKEILTGLDDDRAER